MKLHKSTQATACKTYPGSQSLGWIQAISILSTFSRAPNSHRMYIFLKIFYWSIVDLQFCVNFSEQSESVSQIYIHVFLDFTLF